MMTCKQNKSKQKLMILPVKTVKHDSIEDDLQEESMNTSSNRMNKNNDNMNVLFVLLQIDWDLPSFDSARHHLSRRYENKCQSHSHSTTPYACWLVWN